MKKVSQIKGGAILSYLSIGISNLVAIVYTPLMIRLLGQSEYGLYTLVSSFVAYLGLMDFGFGSTYMRFYTQYKHTKDDKKVASLNGMFFLVFSIIGALALVCGLVMCNYTNAIFGSKLTSKELETAHTLFILLVISMAISFPCKLFQVYINANERFIFTKTVNIIKTVVNPFIMLPLLMMGYKSVAVVAMTLAYNIIIDIINIYYCFHILKLKISFRNCEFSLLRGIMGFAFFVFLGEIVDEINWNVDKFILGRTSGTIAVAVYGVASQISMYYRQFSTAISSVFIPRINKIVAVDKDENKSLTELMIRVGRIQYIVLGLIVTGFAFVGKSFCVLWAGPEYLDSYYITLVLILPSTIPLIQNIGVNALVAKNKHRFRSVLYFLISIFNVALSIPLCIMWEGLGAAIGTAIAIIVGNGFIINWYYSKLGLDIGSFWKSILRLSKGMIIPLVLGIAMLIFDLPSNWLVLLGSIVVYAVFYLVSMYFLGFNEEEKGYIKTILSKFRRSKI
ncbi:MAG: lipopolysaccharide biosynthesis protein [Ruminococcus sp.]|nr:lipopolysaccharide biosynthesis protein [Ruminococcus sp.]